MARLRDQLRSPAASRKFLQGLSGLGAATDTELDKFGNVQAATSRFAPRDPPLGLVDFVRKLSLREPGLIPHLSKERWDAPVNQCSVRLRHRPRLSAAGALKRFSHISLDAEIASDDNESRRQMRKCPRPANPCTILSEVFCAAD